MISGHAHARVIKAVRKEDLGKRVRVAMTADRLWHPQEEPYFDNPFPEERQADISCRVDGSGLAVLAGLPPSGDSGTDIQEALFWKSCGFREFWLVLCVGWRQVRIAFYGLSQETPRMESVSGVFPGIEPEAVSREVSELIRRPEYP